MATHFPAFSKRNTRGEQVIYQCNFIPSYITIALKIGIYMSYCLRKGDGEYGIRPQRKSLEGGLASSTICQLWLYKARACLPNRLPLVLPSAAFQHVSLTVTFSTPRRLLLRLVARFNTCNDSLAPVLHPRLPKQRPPISSVPRIGAQVQVLPAKPLRPRSKLEKDLLCQCGNLADFCHIVHCSPHGREHSKISTVTTMSSWDFSLMPTASIAAMDVSPGHPTHHRFPTITRSTQPIPR
jgi:hypothetical protein